MSTEQDSLNDAFAAGWNPLINMYTGYSEDSVGAIFFPVTLTAGSTLYFTSTVTVGTSATVVVGNEELTLVDQTESSVTAAENLEITFKFVGTGNNLGSIQVTGFESGSVSLNDSSLYFLGSDGVYTFSPAATTFPVYGETGNIVAAVSGIFASDGSLYIGAS